MWLIVPFFLQACCILFDEFYFHIKRGLPKWERIGHPIDTLSVLVCLGYILVVPFSSIALYIYIALAAFSSILVTKDEFVHKEHCPASEQWLHALLFTLHPIVLTAAGLIWSGWVEIPFPFLEGQFAIMSCFLLYQIIYWNFVWEQ